MAKLIVVTREGQTREISARVSVSVMELIRDSGIDELQSLCGGCCSCATCHVHVAPDCVIKLPPMSEVENDLLDANAHRNEFSRLSCQIEFSSQLDGLTVRIAEED